MRALTTLAFCLLLGPMQAQACSFISKEEAWVFFEAVPNPPPDADLIAKVSISDLNIKIETRTVTGEVTVMQVFKSSDARLRQGDKVSMTYKYLGCPPEYKKGHQGIVIAKIGTDSKGRLVLYPYMHRYGHGPITPPTM